MRDPTDAVSVLNHPKSSRSPFRRAEAHLATVRHGSGGSPRTSRTASRQSPKIGDNVGEYANLDKAFLDGIAEHDVLVPITAIRRHDGVVEVRNGQRRTVAACKVGLTTVPVYVLAATAADTAAETIDRIVHQIVTNDQSAT